MFQENLSRINAKKTNPKDIIIKPLKNQWQRKVLKHPEKNDTSLTKEQLIKPAGDFSTGMT